MGLQLGSLLDGITLTMVNRADSVLGTELNLLTDQLPASLRNDITSSITNLFQANDVSTALPGLSAVTSKLQNQSHSLSQAQTAALSRLLDLSARIARARLLLDQLYDELDRLLQSASPASATGGTGSIQGIQSASATDAMKARIEIQRSMQEMQSVSDNMKAQNDLLKSVAQNLRN